MASMSLGVGSMTADSGMVQDLVMQVLRDDFDRGDSSVFYGLVGASGTFEHPNGSFPVSQSIDQKFNRTNAKALQSVYIKMGQKWGDITCREMTVKKGYV